MVSIEALGMLGAKAVKLVLNLAILVIYAKCGKNGFLGVGGEWNLNEPRSADIEILTSGVLIVFFIYTSVVLISYALGALEEKKTIVELMMNFIGLIMFVMVGGIALHYWLSYEPEVKQIDTPAEAIWGIILGVLCLLNGIVFLVDLILTGSHYLKYDQYD